MSNYFGYGISSVSNATIDLNQQDFPKQKNSFITPGKKVTSHIWNLFEFGKIHNNQTLNFVIKTSHNMVFTPGEHSELANKSINFLTQQSDKYSKTSEQAEILKNASEVLSQAKKDIEYVNQCRNVLLAG